MKFFNLFKKELRELLTPTTIITTIGIMLILVFVGEAFGGIMGDVIEEASQVTICDQDNSEISKSIIKALTVSKVNEETGLPEEYDEELVKLVTLESDDYAKELKRLKENHVLIIPEGFGEKLMKGEKIELINLNKMTSGATLANVSSNEGAVESIRKVIKETYLLNSGLTVEQLANSETIVSVSEKTIVDDKSADISVSMVSSLASMQSMFLPIIVYALVMFSSQLIISAISTEKIDKTLETLLSAPVSRLSVLSSKMLAAGVVAALNAVAYMIGFNQMMKGMYAGMGTVENSDAILSELGLKMTTSGYILLGIQLFLTLFISLSVSLVLGALAKDAKSAQTLMMPITFMAMIPYIISMLIDIKSLAPAFRYLIYAIPFTHTFIASDNIMFGNTTLFWGGVIYQVVLLAICMTIAVKIFTSDKIFTLTLDFNKKSKFDKKKKKGLLNFGK
ncbi:MAG: ABC transporter permease [Oscillospiraceae bacterium]|nr:ABC transporter permease [Oscillospiraceae bacterium]